MRITLNLEETKKLVLDHIASLKLPIDTMKVAATDIHFDEDSGEFSYDFDAGTAKNVARQSATPRAKLKARKLSTPKLDKAPEPAVAADPVVPEPVDQQPRKAGGDTEETAPATPEVSTTASPTTGGLFANLSNPNKG